MMLSLIGMIIWIGVWFYFGALLFSMHDDDDSQAAAILYFTPAAIGLIFSGIILIIQDKRKFYVSSAAEGSMSIHLIDENQEIPGSSPGPGLSNL